MKRIYILFFIFLPMVMAGQQPIIIDHTCIDLDEIPNEWIDSAKANLWIGYGHTSHGSQLATGMDALDTYFTDGTYAWSHTGGPGELHLFEGSGNNPGYLAIDCGTVGWDTKTREYLDDFPGCNVIIWSWCGQVDDVDLPSHYLVPMEQLEIDYPDVQFVYMTGHLEGEGPGGNLELANQHIRDFCAANNKILYDFADIEKFSPDADTNFQVYFGNDECDYNHPNGHTANWADYWLAENPGHELSQISQLCGSCSHSVTLNCTKKGIAAWYLWARLAGWDGGSTLLTSSFTLQDTACIVNTVNITYTGNATPAATYNWDFDGASIISGSGQGPYTVEWPTTGDKTVSLYVEESGNTSGTTNHDIYIENLSSDFQLPDTAYIANTVDIIYTGNASDLAIYYWDFDGASIISGSGQGPYTIQWPTTGDKTVSLYVEESGFVSNTTTNDIYINFLSSDFQLPDTACIAHTVDIIYEGNASGSALYYWDFDGASIISGSGQGPYTVEWSTAGDKTVSLYVEESGNTSGTTTNDIYIENLSSDFQLPDTAFIASTVDIIYTGNASDLATYNWDFDGATIISGSGQGPYTLEWPTSGDKTVSLYVEESGFVSNTTTNDIYINFLSSDFQLPDTACIAHTVDIIYTGNASGSASYYWDFDGATIISGSGQGPYTLEWPSIGDKTVSLYVEESGNTSITTTNGIYIENLTSDFQLPDTSCRTCTVDIYYTGNASDVATYYWDFDGATIISGSGQGPYTLEWATSGDKTVSLYVEESGFASDTTTNDIYIVFLTSDFQVQDTTCIAHTVDIIYTGNALPSATYYWDFDGATIISGSGQGPYTVQWPDIGDKTVSLYVEESNYITDTTTNQIYVENLTSDFHIQDFACSFATVLVTYTGNASDSAEYNWDFDGANIINGSGQGPYTVLWSGIGNKAVSLYVEESAFVSDTSSNQITINEKPVFTIVPYPNDTVSTLDTITLTGDITSVSYLWSTGDTTQSIDVFNICGQGGGCQNYWLEVTNEAGCSNTEYIIVLFDGPTALSEFSNYLEIKTYPNPFNDYLNIELEIIENGQYLFEVFDCVGSPAIQELKHLKPGKNKISLEMNHVYPGVYILSVKSDRGQIGVQKVIKSSK